MSDLSKQTLNENQLNEINAGTITPNYYPRWAYERAGFTCDYHFLAKDEFKLNGKVYTEKEANAIMSSMGYSKRLKRQKSKMEIQTVILYNGQPITK